MYRIPIRLWSVVTSQLATLPRCQSGTPGVSALVAKALLEVGVQRVHLLLRPVAPDRWHDVTAGLCPSLARDALDRLGVGERRRSERRAVAAATVEPVALGTEAHPLLPAEL